MPSRAALTWRRPVGRSEVRLARDAALLVRRRPRDDVALARRLPALRAGLRGPLPLALLAERPDWDRERGREAGCDPSVVGSTSLQGAPRDDWREARRRPLLVALFALDLVARRPLPLGLREAALRPERVCGMGGWGAWDGLANQHCYDAVKNNSRLLPEVDVKGW